MSSRFRFEPTGDAELVRRVLTHPRIWPWVTDDYAPPREQFQVVMHPSVHYIACRDGWELLGIFGFEERNGICWEVHLAMLPSGWGRALGAFRAMIRWIWAETRCERIVGSIPADNRLALALARRAGLTEYGLNPESIQRNGTLRDQVLVGISRPPGLRADSLQEAA